MRRSNRVKILPAPYDLGKDRLRSVHDFLRQEFSPSYEEFRICFIRGNAIIAHQRFATQYRRDRVGYDPNKLFEHLLRIRYHFEVDFDRLLVAHNHPGASALPSYEDFKSSGNLLRIFEGRFQILTKRHRVEVEDVIIGQGKGKKTSSLFYISPTLVRDWEQNDKFFYNFFDLSLSGRTTQRTLVEKAYQGVPKKLRGSSWLSE
jgi:hypothetical protein